MYASQQEATCGFQVCQHPLCWATNRQSARGLLYLHQDKDSSDELEKEKSTLRLGTSRSNGNQETNDNEDYSDIFEGFPTMTILNMIDEYGFDNKDRYPSPNFDDLVDQPKGDFKARKRVNIAGETLVSKLALKSVTCDSAEDVMVPANTPLQSSHGFGDYDHERRSSPLSRTVEQRPVFGATTTPTEEEQPGFAKAHYGKVQLKIGDKGAASLAPKKTLVWCPAAKSKRRQQYLQSKRKAKSPPSMKAVSLPLHSVPEFGQTPTSHKAIKGTIPKRRQPFYATARKIRAVSDAAKVSQTRGPSGTTPQEIAQLRKVPVEVLMRVLHQAKENGIITKAQTSFLLAQVVGKKDKLPAIGETPRAKSYRDSQYQPNETSPKTPLETKNMKILSVDDIRSHTSRTMSADPVYRMDTAPTSSKSESLRRQTAPPATRSTEFAPIHMSGVYDDRTTQTRSVDKIPEMEDSVYDEKLRDLAEENLRSIGALPKEVLSPKKSPVKYVATVFEEALSTSPPIKPFHYPRSPREIFLGPIPSPPPPTPPTERDSSYDPQIGGSTMVVNPSITGPSSVSSLADRRSSLRGETRTPTAAGGDVDTRLAKTTQTSLNGSQLYHNQISPFGSSTGADGWPQVNEEDFLKTAGSSELACSPLPSFTEEEMRNVSRNNSAGSREETSLSEKFQNLSPGEIHSPAPPPPSPEPISPGDCQSTEDVSPTSPRVGGAATALGLVTVAKSSSQTSPETGSGITPTPVVSSIRSDAETPLGRATRTQTLGSTPAIPETPFENDSEDGVVVAAGDDTILEDKKSKPADVSTQEKTADESPVDVQAQEYAENDFEKNVSSEVAKEELQKEMEKLDIS